MGPGQQGVQGYIVRQSQAGVAGMGVIGQDLHAHGLGDPGDGLADAAHADDAQGLAGQLHEGIVPEAPIRATGPAALVDGLAMMAYLVADLQQQGYGKLGYGCGAIGGDVGDQDTQLLAGGHVHHIVAGGQHADHADGRTSQKGLPGNGGLVGIYDIRLADPGNYLFRLGAGIDPQLAQGLQPCPGKVAGVFRKPVQHHDLRHWDYLLVNGLISLKKGPWHHCIISWAALQGMGRKPGWAIDAGAGVRYGYNEKLGVQPEGEG